MKKFCAAAVLSALALLLTFCHRANKSTEKNPYADSPYASLRDSVGYVGMQTCMACHQNVYNTFVKTGMGQSFDVATHAKSSGRFDAHALVHDTLRNMYYRPHWQNDSLFITEYRLQNHDTVYKRTEKIAYIVGSGQHTNSHIWRVNEFLFQAPITFYTQQGVWDLAPGFEVSNAPRWNRIISQECMNCHNMYPHADMEAENRYVTVMHGIECERCHGPGAAHVAAKQRGERVDTAKEIDYTIVNPKKLPRDKQVELCQRCHLQGITVLNDAKTFFDFKPGMNVSDVMNVFMPRYEGKPEKFIMASHADRMKQSKCYLNSNMTCLTCHNPHVSVKFTSDDVFNNACKNCHAGAHACTAPVSERMTKNDNCYQCHMPVSETLDIPHVTIHDHRIHVPEKIDKTEPLKFVRLACLTQKNPTALLMAQGYLTAFESFDNKQFLLDSAQYYLQHTDEKANDYNAAMVRYYFLKNDYQNVIRQSKLINEKTIDAWTNYRIGEAFYQTGNYDEALNRYNAALARLPEQLDFLDKKGKALVQLKRNDEAAAVFNQIAALNPAYENAWSNLSYLQLLKGDAAYSLSLAEKSLSLNPDFEDALMNKAAALFALNRSLDAALVLKRVIEINPRNRKAQFALQQIHHG